MTDPHSLQALRAAFGWGSEQDWPRALKLLERAAEAGEAGAERQLSLLTQAPIEQLLSPPQPERLTPAARVAVARGFAPPGFSDWLIDRARDRLQRSTSGGGNVDDNRTALTCFFKPRDSDLVLAVLQHRAAVLLGVPVECHEAPSVISYEPGQHYVAHLDSFDPNIPRERANLLKYGQRVGTVVTYLNVDFEGAPTIFPRLNLSFKGGEGDAVFFANVLPDGRPDPLTLHQAPAPTSGRKWVLSQWIRAKRLSLSSELLPE
jgi:prolyl 4-hydroxylase